MRIEHIVAICVMTVFTWSTAIAQPVWGETPDFNRDVLPILSDNCSKCHGPDEKQRQGELRLDVRESVFADRGGYAAIVARQPEKSELIRRIFSKDPDDRMPPADSNLSLTDAQKQTLSRWIAAGAQWQEHWAFIAPVKTAAPAMRQVNWPRNDIDHFILVKLEEKGLSPSAEVDKARLLRRVTVDLTGLPPTTAEIDAFMGDYSTGAYEGVVDRLLASDAHAERLALDWMDLSRYADSHGLHADGWRRMWPWRDWVIQAFKKNMPYDKFVTWQIAGDLLPNASREEILATAFHRNHPMTAEGGIIDEEFRLYYVFDRVETTATAFLGLTMQCSKCHDHKFDPLQQREYYQMAAFYNNLRELGMTGDDGDFGPLLQLPSPEVEHKLVKLDAKIVATESQLDIISKQARSTFDAMSQKNVAELIAEAANSWQLSAGHRFPLDSVLKAKQKPSNTPSNFTEESTDNVNANVNDRQATGNNNQPAEPVESVSEQFEWWLDGNDIITTADKPILMDGIDGHGVSIVDEYRFLSLKEIGLFDAAEPFTVAIWIRPKQRLDKLKPKTLRSIFATAGAKNQLWRGWEFNLDSHNRLVLQLIHKQPDNLIEVSSVANVPVGHWTHIGFRYDGTGKAAGVRLYINGRTVRTTVFHDRLTKSIYPVQHAIGFPVDEQRVMRVGRSHRQFAGDFGIYHGTVDDIRIYAAALTDLEFAYLFSSYETEDITDELDKTTGIAFSHWLRRGCTDYATVERKLRELHAERFRLFSAVPELMVMNEMPQPGETRVLFRGEYDQPRERVHPGTPAAVLMFPEDLPKNRLGLSQWLFHADNPLTARVTVNRYWQLIFGEGLVRTPHDFGLQGARPTHPKLLDWMAVSFRDSGWNVRGMLKQIVMSATYRQSTVQRADLQHKDPSNVLLGRSPSYRYPAEIIRDQALAASGLLNRTVGGPSVKPYQPAGLWSEKNNFSQYLFSYKADKGDKLYRRSLYTFIRRTAPHPAMVAFDAPDRTVCTVKREITNTPLQALVLLNDPQFVEAARVMAELLQKKEGDTLTSQINLAFRLLVSRTPNGQEMLIFRELYSYQLARFREDAKAADLLLSIGEHSRNRALDSAVTAALAVVANTIMNYEEFYMKR